jgi:hypothetical protein
LSPLFVMEGGIVLDEGTVEDVSERGGMKGGESH